MRKLHMLHVLCVRVANSPGLTRKLEVSAFDLQAPGFELQSPDYTANCMKNPLPDHFGVISVSQMLQNPTGELTALPTPLAG